MKFKHAVLAPFVSLVVATLPPGAAAQSKDKSLKSSAELQVSAVDLAGQPLPFLKAGEYARLSVRANLRDIPHRALARINAKASFTPFDAAVKLS